jgi:hypothetical protein
VPNFPSFFICYGPNTNLGHSSALFQIECGANYIVSAIRECIERDTTLIEARQDAHDAYQQFIQQNLERSVFGGSCHSWYRTADGGKMVTNWPFSTTYFWWSTRNVEPSDLQFGQQ